MEQLMTAGKKHIQNNTKKEIFARMIVNIAIILAVFMTYFMINGWVQSILFYRFILEETGKITFNLIVKISGSAAVILVFLLSLAVLIPINRLIEIESIKHAIVTIAIVTSIYFLVMLSVSIYFMSIYASNELIIGFVFYFLSLGLILFGLIFFWFEVKRQRLIFSALLFEQEFKNENKENNENAKAES